MVEVVKFMGNYLLEKMDGWLSVKFYLGGQFGLEGSMFEIVMFGGFDMICIFVVVLNNIVLLIKLFSLFFLFCFIVYQCEVVDGEIGEVIFELFEDFGLRGLVIYDIGGCGFYIMECIILYFLVLDGMKICVLNLDIFLVMMWVFGVNLMLMNFSEVYQGLVQNVIEGVENNWLSYISMWYYEVVFYFLEMGYFWMLDMLIMSFRIWENFLLEDQLLVKEVVCQLVGVMCSLWDVCVVDFKCMLFESGGEILFGIDIDLFCVLMGLVYEQFVIFELVLYLEEIDCIGEVGV